MHDEIKGASIVRNIRTESIEFAEVERSWQRIGSLEELATHPVLTLSAFDVYGAGSGKRRTEC